MAVSVGDINSLFGKDVYYTSNDKHVLTKDFEHVVHSPEYYILGFLNDYMYASNGQYISKYTLNGDEVAQIYLEVEHASFCEGLTYFYAYIDRTLYKITDQFVVEWSLTFDDAIQAVSVDINGNFYVMYNSIRIIQKFTNTKEEIMTITASDDPTKTVRLYNCFISSGGSWFYIIGSRFWGYNKQVESFIDKYNARTGELIEDLIFDSNSYIDIDDRHYQYHKFYIKGDYIYIYAHEYVSKINIKGINIWSYLCDLSDSENEISRIEYSNNSYDDFVYFTEDYPNANGHGFGKLSINGNLIWKIALEESSKSSNFKMCIYNSDIYTSAREYIKYTRKYILSLDDERVLFKTEDGNLIEIVEYNTDELYSADHYYGKRLLADFIKDDVERTYHANLMHDNGDIIVDDNEVLLLEDEYNFTRIDTNYEYKHLLSRHWQSVITGISLLFTKESAALKTKLGNLLKSKEVYLPERVIEYISTLDNDNIIAMNEDNIIRDMYGYIYSKYLVADRSMYWTDISTKIGEFLITKVLGYRIAKKTRRLYKYLLSKYNDVNIVVEWLIENGVMDTMLPEYVDKIRHHTSGMIYDMQVAGTPVLYDIQSNKRFEYTYDGVNYPIRTWGTQIFSCNNLPFDKRTGNPDRIYIDSIANLVESKEMRPFLLFLNGKAIKWSDCTIVKDWKYTYVVIDNTNPEESNLTCILFPCLIRYGEDNNILAEGTTDSYLYFDSDGVLTEDASNVYLRVEIIDPNIVGVTDDYCEKYIEVPNNYNQLASEKNIFVFEDMKLFDESRFYINEYGKDIFTYDRDTTNTIFKSFYYIKANDYYGNLYNIPSGNVVKNDIIDNAINGGYIGLGYENFMSTFNFKLYRTKSYSENIATAVEYIMSYNMALLIQYYKDQSNIKSYVYTGKELLSRRSSTTGCVKLPRNRNNGLQDYIVVFVNNDLYTYYKDITYTATDILLPLYDISNDDTIEVLHFKNVDNSYHSLTVTTDKVDYIADTLRYDNFLLFGNSRTGSIPYDSFDVENSKYYNLDFSYKNNFSNNKYINTEINLNDVYYIGKEINICSKRQYQYMYYNINNTKSIIELSPDFRFCHLTNHYLVFKNKKKLAFSDWTLLLPIETDSNRIQIQFTNELINGDIIEIFYLPDAYEEINVSNSDSKRYGDITMDTEELGYSFDKDLFLIFVNGSKINYNYIENISNHRVRIKNDITSSGTGIITGVSVMKFLQPDALLGKLFSYSDEWSDAVDALTPTQYNRLLVNHVKK